MDDAGGLTDDTRGRLQHELDAIADEIGRSVTLDGPDGALLGYSSQGADVDPARIDAILVRRTPAPVLAYQRSHGVDAATGAVRVPANPDLGMTARVGLAIRGGRRVLAYLWVIDDAAPLDGGAMDAVLACGQRLQALLQPARPMSADALVAQLLSDRPPPRLVNDLAEWVDRRGPCCLQFVAAVPTTTAGGERRPLAMTAPAQPAAAAAVVGRAWRYGRLLLLLDTPDSARAPAEVVLPLLPRPPTWVVGHSPPFRPVTAEAPGLAARALAAADCAAVDGALGTATSWSGLGPYRRLLRTTSPADWPEPLPIPDDDRSAAMLRRTLEAYLDHAGDAAATIATLGIHRTTFYYRLERLSGRYGIPLDDGLARTELHLALKTRRLALARDHFGWTDAFLARLA